MSNSDYRTDAWELHVGDVREVLPQLPAESVDCALTSPPFYGLRDYGTGKWEGGNPDHSHDTVAARNGRGGSGSPGKQTEGAFPSRLPARVCSCGATYHDQQIGSEATPDEWVQALVEVFGELRRVLKPHGTLWVEVGDSFNSGTSTSRKSSTLEGSHGYWENPHVHGYWENPHVKRRLNIEGLKAKDLIGTPWLLAFALRADGWWLRNEIIWNKPNAMPGSATDRCIVAHSRIFMLSKRERYHFDRKAIAEPASPNTHARYAVGRETPKGREGYDGWDESTNGHVDEKNPRTVWTIPTQGYPEAHFATWPEALAERIILAGCPKGGTILDPFMGSGTSAVVARRLGRSSVGIELNEEYADLARKRMASWWKTPSRSPAAPEAQGSLLEATA